METTHSTQENDPAKSREQDEQKALAEMNSIRSTHRETERSSLDRFEEETVPLSERPVHVEFEIHHPDGITAVHVDNQQGLVDILVSMYGDQPLYGFESPEPDTTDTLPEKESDKEDLGLDLER